MVTGSRNETAAAHIDRLLHKRKSKRRIASTYVKSTPAIVGWFNVKNAEKKWQTKNEMENEEFKSFSLFGNKKEYELKMKTKSFFPASLCTRISSFGLMLLLKEPRHKQKRATK